MSELAELDATPVVTPDTNSPKVTRHMRRVPRRMSAIEYIVETARPNEVTHVQESDYYNQHLWRSYDELSTRYSCS